MAQPNLKPCIDCGHMVSVNASTCPQCGRKAPTEQKKKWPVLKTFVGVSALVFFVLFLIASFQEDDLTLYLFIMAAVFGICFGLLSAKRTY